MITIEMGLTPLCSQLFRHFEIIIENPGKPTEVDMRMMLHWSRFNVRLKSRRSVEKTDLK